MARALTIIHRFVELIPETLDEGTVYVSIEYATAVHKCCCGCGEEIVTPLTPTDWRLIYDGASISLAPSVGNWSLKCRSHYCIIRSRVRWARELTPRQIEDGRSMDRDRKRDYYAGKSVPVSRGAGLDLLDDLFYESDEWIEQ